jgi:hypothetical protein
MKTDWEGPLDAAVPPVCVDALAALPPPNARWRERNRRRRARKQPYVPTPFTPEQWDDLVPSPDAFAFRIDNE